MSPKTAVVLFSGGLDTTTALCWALKVGYRCAALSIVYGQRHEKEVGGAGAIAKLLGAQFIKIKLELPWLAVSSLIDRSKKLREAKLEQIGKTAIPGTYVPARNLIFTALGVSLADSMGAEAVVVGANSRDYSGYPDCRPDFYRYLQTAVDLGTKTGAELKKIKILTPLMRMNKADIVRMAVKLRAPLRLTWSCYAGGKYPCGKCDSCKLRAEGFKRAGVKDPANDRQNR